MAGVLSIACAAVFSQEISPPVLQKTEARTVEIAPSATLGETADPIALFQQLLAADAVERRKTLEIKSEPKRKYLESKLREYDRLSVQEKEARLKMLGLRYYLEPLMRLPAAMRSGQLAAIPPEYAQLVKARLDEWDLLPPPLQKDVLDTEIARRYFTRLQSGSSPDREETWKLFPPEKRQELEDEIAKLQITPPEQRQQLYARFDRFFELSEGEKRKTVNSLPESDRRQVSEAVDIMEKYPPQQRKIIIDSLQKVTSMTSGERQRFLKNAERWQAMSAEERRAWRELVDALPPTPPGMPLPAAPTAR